MKRPVITTEGRRCYVQVEYGHPATEVLKGMNAHWDRESRRWWLTSSKATEVSLALAGFDENTQPLLPDPDQIKVFAKASYKGRNYYVVAFSGDGQSCRLVTLDVKVDFWAKLAAADGSEVATILKRYEPRREGFGRHAREVQQTLGGLKRFIERQKNPATRTARCTECDHVGPYGEPCSECGGEGTHLG